MIGWQKINRNSLAQFWRGRVRYVFVSTRERPTYRAGKNAAKRAKRRAA